MPLWCAKSAEQQQHQHPHMHTGTLEWQSGGIGLWTRMPESPFNSYQVTSTIVENILATLENSTGQNAKEGTETKERIFMSADGYYRQCLRCTGPVLLTCVQRVGLLRRLWYEAPSIWDNIEWQCGWTACMAWNINLSLWGPLLWSVKAKLVHAGAIRIVTTHRCRISQRNEELERDSALCITRREWRYIRGQWWFSSFPLLKTHINRYTMRANLHVGLWCIINVEFSRNLQEQVPLHNEEKKIHHG